MENFKISRGRLLLIVEVFGVIQITNVGSFLFIFTCRICLVTQESFVIINL